MSSRSVKSSSSFVITVNSDARALVADTRSIWMQCSAVDFRWGAGVLIPIMGCWRFDSNNSVSTGRFLTFIYLMSSESRYLGYTAKNVPQPWEQAISLQLGITET